MRRNNTRQGRMSGEGCSAFDGCKPGDAATANASVVGQERRRCKAASTARVDRRRAKRARRRRRSKRRTYAERCERYDRMQRRSFRG